MYQIIFEKKVQKFLSQHKGQPIIIQFEKALKLLIINPFDSSLDIKSLKWYEWFYRLRLGKYRFIYEVIDYKLIIDVVNADSRGDIYKGISRK